MLLGILAFVFYQSTHVMMKGNSQSSLQRNALAFSRKLSNAVQFGTVTSLTVAADGGGLSLLTSDDQDGKFRFDPALSTALWSDYQVFYLDSAAGQILRRKVSVVGFPEEATPGPIENFDSAQPLPTYYSGGQPVLGDVQSAVFAEPLPGLIKVTVGLARDDTRSTGPETYDFSVTRHFRN